MLYDGTMGSEYFRECAAIGIPRMLLHSRPCKMKHRDV
jgi:hypothetical protein